MCFIEVFFEIKEIGFDIGSVFVKYWVYVDRVCVVIVVCVGVI